MDPDPRVEKLLDNRESLRQLEELLQSSESLRRSSRNSILGAGGRVAEPGGVPTEPGALQKEHSKAETSLLGYEMGRMRSGITLSCSGRVSWTSRS